MNAFTSISYPYAYVPNTVERARAEVRRQADAGFDLVKVYDYLTEEEYLAVLEESGRLIAQGADVGNVVVQRRTADGLVDYPYTVDFAFAFRAFHRDAPPHP